MVVLHIPVEASLGDHFRRIAGKDGLLFALVPAVQYGTCRTGGICRRYASLEDELLNAQVDRLMQEGLREVQAIDPNVKSLDALGESFARLIANGVPTKEAYYASKAMELKEKILAPDAIGRVSDTKTERDYYTSEELDNLTDEEMDANWDKVMRSMGRL